jgi:hypothetical protein
MGIIQVVLAFLKTFSPKRRTMSAAGQRWNRIGTLPGFCLS